MSDISRSADGSRPDGRLRIIALAPNDWFGQWMNRQQLLSRLVRDNLIVYSTGAWTVWDRTLPEWKRANLFGAVRQADGVLVEEAPRLLLRWPTVKLLDELALSMHARRLMHIAGSSEALPTVAMLFHPMFQPYLRHLRADVVAYHAYDLFADSPGWSGRMGELEDALLRDADIVSTVTPAIAEQLTRRVNRPVRILPNGVDTAAFAAARQQPAQTASALEGIPRPRIGHVGNMNSKVDFSLIAELAARRPKYHFVLLGSETGGRDDKTEAALARCRAIPNVHFVGYRDRREMPGILVSMDVNAMFYRVSEKSWALAGYPLKLHEYLAAGRPIVSADQPVVRSFAHLLKIVRTPEEWLAGLDDALAEADEEMVRRRWETAEANGWDVRARELGAWLRDAASRRGAQRTDVAGSAAGVR